jgi:hypothetical protein
VIEADDDFGYCVSIESIITEWVKNVNS